MVIWRAISKLIEKEVICVAMADEATRLQPAAQPIQAASLFSPIASAKCARAIDVTNRIINN